MKFSPTLSAGTLIRRYKRFFADVETQNGVLTLHCPNTGAMSGCSEPGSEVWYSLSDNPKRKLPGTLEAVVTPDGVVGVHPGRANALVREALESAAVGFLPNWQDDCESISNEVPIPGGGGRFDLGLGDRKAPRAVIEVKSVTLHVGQGVGAFPDAVSERAKKHVQALTDCALNGCEASLVFCVQHQGVQRVRPADEVDPSYGEALRRAAAAGVGIYAGRCELSRRALTMVGDCEVVLT